MKNKFNIREVEIHYSRPNYEENIKVIRSSDAAILLRQFADSNRIDFKEFFWVILLSQSQQVLGIGELSVGTTTSTAVNTKEIFQLALKGNAPNIIVGHNHPSGNVQPSEQDISLTQKIISFAKLVDITLLDHIIISSDGHFSFADNRLI